MKLRDQDRDLDPRAERELAAVDRALAGEPVDSDLDGWAELTALLAAERPEPRESWSAGLDERAAARFEDGGGSSGRARDLAARVRELLPRRLAPPVAALATLVIVAVVAASTLELGGTGDGDSTSSLDSGSATSTTSASGDSAAETAPIPPNAQAASGADGSSDLDSAGAGGVAFQAQRNGKIAPGKDRRQVERDVTLALSARPDDVADASDEAIAITRSLDGIVASSQLDQAGRRSRATLQLVLPTRNLDAALDRLTKIANVNSLNESTVDITRPFVSAKDRLADARAERKQLLRALGNAAGDTEAEALRKQIKSARRRISRARSSFENIARRARLSDLSLTISGDPGAATSDDGRTLGGWLDDALSVLRDLAGILLITAVIVVPLGLIAALIWLAATTFRHRRREAALDG